jgi:hypothetical protein
MDVANPLCLKQVVVDGPTGTAPAIGAASTERFGETKRRGDES